MITALAILGGAFSLSIGSLNAGIILHASMASNILHSPMSFFDTNPVGRIINRFSKDIDTVDNSLPWNLRSWLMCFFSVSNLDSDAVWRNAGFLSFYLFFKFF